MGTLKRTSIILCLLLVDFLTVSGQYYTSYGQNRIQYKRFEWVYYSTTHFDIYYYKGGEDYAKQAIDFLEEEFNRITDVLGYAPYSKTKIFIYNSIHELQQSNIGIEGAEYDIGGQTDFVKLQLEIAHPGTAIAFKTELLYKISRVLIEDMLFGGSLAEVFQSSYLLNLPNWFIDGAARYMAYGWSEDMDDYIRDYLIRKKITRVIRIQGDHAGMVGQSVWNYIALNYGKSNVSNILNLTRIIRNEENSIASTLGLTYKQFLADWQNYYILDSEEIIKSYEHSPKENLVIKTRNKQLEYHTVRLNPAGTRIAYSQNEWGRFHVYVLDVETGNTHRVLSGGIHVQGQQIDTEMPLLDWVDDETVGILYFKRGYIYLTTHNLATHERQVKPLPRFNNVKSFAFNENGRLAVVSGDIDGKNDLFLVSMSRNAIRRITSDIYDDLDPSFIPGTAALVFSSNRTTDFVTSAETESLAIENLRDNFNIFLYDLDTSVYSYTRVTNTFSQDRKPIAKNPYELFYLSDQRGITNLFSYSFLDSTFHQITNFDRTVQDYDLHFNDDRMLYLLLERGAEQVYLNKEMDLDQNRFSPQTARQRMLQAQYVTEIYNRRQLKAKQEEKKEKRETEALPKVDTMLTGSNEPGIDPEDFRFEGEPENDLIDTDNYRFSDKVNTNQFRPESFFTNYQRLELDEKIIGPIPYIPQFSFNQLTTSFAVDPIRGIGLVLETQISDVLGNHKLKGGGFVVRDLSQGDIYAEYDFLKYWMDLKLRIDRKSYFFEGNGEDENNLRQRNNLSKISIGASVPLSNWFRIEFNPFYAQTEFRNLHYSAVINRAPNDYAPNEKLGYAGFEARSVFDNTIDKGFNMIQGTRASLEFIKYQNLQTVEKSFGNIRFDLRHYQPVYKSLTLATRIFYGQFVGQNPQKYMLGGIPNWLGFYRTHPHPSNDPLAPDNSVNLGHVLFSEFVYNLRGFQYNEKYGASSFLVNTELRVPVFQLMSKAPPTSNFLRNFVIVPFFDMGSAWTGLPPIKAENSENTIVYKPKNPSFSAEISNFRNPWLSSYGIGMRTVLLDYYIKIDYSRPILDMKYLNSRITLSVGLDF